MKNYELIVRPVHPVSIIEATKFLTDNLDFQPTYSIKNSPDKITKIKDINILDKAICLS